MEIKQAALFDFSHVITCPHVEIAKHSLTKQGVSAQGNTNANTHRHDDQKLKLGIGLFLNELLTDFELKAKHFREQPEAANVGRLSVYSGHDTTLMPLLEALGGVLRVVAYLFK